MDNSIFTFPCSCDKHIQINTEEYSTFTART